jgi:hypothetical protein
MCKNNKVQRINSIHALQSKSVNKNCRDKKTQKTIMCKKTNAHKTSKTPHMEEQHNRSKIWQHYLLVAERDETSCCPSADIAKGSICEWR